MTSTELFFAFSILVPLLAGFGLRLRPKTTRAWGMGITAAAVAVACNLFLAWAANHTTTTVFAGKLLFIDQVSELISLFYSVMILFLLWLMPRGERTAPSIYAVLLCETLALLFFRAENPAVVVGTMGLSIWLLHGESGKSKAHLFFQSLGVVLTAAGLFIISTKFPGMGTSRLPALVAAGAGTGGFLGAAVLFFVAGSVRQGLFPFHIGLKRFSTRCGFPVLFATVTSNMGLYLILRYCIPLLGAGTENVPEVLSIWVVLSLTCLSITVISVNNLRELFSTLISIQSSLILMGALQFDRAGSTGATIQWVVALVAAGGFGLCVWLLQYRSGVSDCDRSTLSFEKMPRVAALYFIFGMGVVDFPATMGFVGEDLLVHSVLQASLIQGMLVLIAMAAASIAIYRSYVGLFLGRSLPTGEVRTDLRPREAYAFALLLLILVGLGLYPTPLAVGTNVLVEKTRATHSTSPLGLHRRDSLQSTSTVSLVK